MRELNWVDIRYLAMEMKDLEGGRVEKIYGGKDDFLFVIFSGIKYFLRIRLPNLVFLTKYKKSYGVPSNFCMFLRKHLNGQIIKKVYQYDCERILIIEFESKRKLVIELFNKGNLYLYENGKLLGSLRKPNKLPEKKDFFNLTKNEIKEMLENSKQDIFVKFLASDLHLGKFYAEMLAGEDRLKKLNEIKPERVIETLEVLKSPPAPNLYDGSFLPFIYRNPKKKFNSYNELIDELFHEEEKRIGFNLDGINKLKHVIELQENALKELEKKKDEYKKIGDKIFSDINYYDSMIEKARRHEVEIKGKNLILDGVKLDIKKDAIENAEEYYKKYKKLKKKIDGAKAAILKVKEKIKNLNVEKERKIREIKEKIREVEEKVKEWYQNFRWVKFDGWLAVGGKNAKQNELLVRKHVSANDIIFHADIYGSPFVVLKNGINAPDEIKRYVAQFTLCYSRAWKEKVPVDVYWVRKSQVTKESSGEYIGFGAFLIKGKKNYVKVSLDWCIGVKDYKLICGPREYVSKKTNLFITIIPGEKSRDEIAKEIRNELSKIDPLINEIPIEEFVRCSIDNSEILKS